MAQSKNTFSKVRIICVFVFFIAAVFAIWLRVFYLQVIKHDHFLSLARKQQISKVTLPARRGTIFDRNNRPLAISVETTSVWIDDVEDYDSSLIVKVAILLKMSTSNVKRKFEKKRVWLKRKILDLQADKLKSFDIKGLAFIKESRRFYPKRYLAGQLIGFTGIDNSGLSGIEYYYNKLLTGKAKTICFFHDGKKRRIFTLDSDWDLSQNSGQDLFLTIDEQIQSIVEKELSKGCRKKHAVRGIALVSNPHTGEILAMANYPFFNPNSFNRYHGRRRKNRTVTDSFEPGSTMKIFLASAAIEEKSYSPEDIIDCLGGSVKVGKLTFRDHAPFNKLKFTEVFAHSSNVGMIKVGMRLGADRIYKYYRKFGFGKKTALGLPGEVSGKLRKIAKWTSSSLGAISIGQEMSVTAIQLAAAVNAVANNGLWIPPKIVKNFIANAASAAHRVISKEAAMKVKKLMRAVVVSGTGKEADLLGYEVAGKTGTAQKYDPRIKRYSKSKYVASFVGFFPFDYPKISICVIIDEPKRPDIWGGTVSAPVFKNIAAKLARHMGIPPKVSI